MKYNKILRKLISTIGLPFSLLSYISTAIIGLIGIIPLLGWILSVVLELFFAIVFIWPLMVISRGFLKLRFMRPVFGIVGSKGFARCDHSNYSHKPSNGFICKKKYLWFSMDIKLVLFMKEYNQQDLIPQTMSSSGRTAMREFWKKHGIVHEQKTGAILMPLSKGQREAMQTLRGKE